MNCSLRPRRGNYMRYQQLYIQLRDTVQIWCCFFKNHMIKWVSLTHKSYHLGGGCYLIEN